MSTKNHLIGIPEPSGVWIPTALRFPLYNLDLNKGCPVAFIKWACVVEKYANMLQNKKICWIFVVNILHQTLLNRCAYQMHIWQYKLLRYNLDVMDAHSLKNVLVHIESDYPLTRGLRLGGFHNN